MTFGPLIWPPDAVRDPRRGLPADRGGAYRTRDRVSRQHPSSRFVPCCGRRTGRRRRSTLGAEIRYTPGVGCSSSTSTFSVVTRCRQIGDRGDRADERAIVSGLNILPLLASAGVVGIAVGFGAQTLVRDLFSGASYLIEDVFRVGDYIESGNAKGIVERITFRTVALRHQNGPLHLPGGV